MNLNKIREFLLFPSYHYHKRLIKKSYKWSKKDIKNFQSKKVKKLINEFGKIETNRDVYKNNLKKFDKYAFKGIVRKTKTGGSRGHPLLIHEDNFFTRQKELAYLFDIWGKIGYKPFDLRVKLRNFSDDKLFKYDLILNTWTLSLNLINKKNIEEVKLFLSKLDPFFIITYPSTISTFIQLLDEKFFRSLKVKGILAGSESFPLNQIKSFKKKYKIPVSFWYGHQERFSLSYYCDKCDMFHFYPSYGFTEFKPWKKKIFKICGYSFRNIGTRFINYDTEDLVLKGKSKCKTNFLTAKKILGRNQELFLDKNGYEQTVMAHIGNLDKKDFYSNVSDFQFIQKSKGKLTVLLKLKNKKNLPLIKKVLIKRFKRTAKLSFKIVNNLILTKLGKRPYLIRKKFY
tara:strand:+ start:34 stop:1233 length:1200 start_codon:yes stop_codon:yes gene_type:complete